MHCAILLLVFIDTIVCIQLFPFFLVVSVVLFDLTVKKINILSFISIPNIHRTQATAISKLQDTHTTKHPLSNRHLKGRGHCFKCTFVCCK